MVHNDKWPQLGSAHDKPKLGVRQGREQVFWVLEASIHGILTGEAGPIEQTRQAVAAQPGYLASLRPLPAFLSAVLLVNRRDSCLPSCSTRLPALPEHRLR